MRARNIALILLGFAALAGCQPKTGGEAESAFPWGPRPTGRYTGIGVYPTGQQWSKVARSGQASDPAAAQTIDDEHIIVVVDSNTGEVRQCGNRSGYCIGTNPWAKPLASSQAEPVKMTSHASSFVSGDAVVSSDAMATTPDSAAAVEVDRNGAPIKARPTAKARQ